MTMQILDEPVEIDRLTWDGWNREHLTKHAVAPDEVAEILSGRPVFGRSRKNRLAVIGPTFTGRMLLVVIGPDPEVPGVHYTFSARPVPRKERRIYHQEIQGGQPS